MDKSKRMSNMELLRILSILLIISFHFVFKGGYVFEPHLSINKLIVKTFYMFGELGVNCFILISGYFMIKGNFKLKKLILLLLQVLFYTIITVTFACYIGIYEVATIKTLMVTIFPVIYNKYWFITAYVILYILSPYLNKLVNLMKKDELKKMLLILLLLYCVVPTFFGAINNNTESLLYYNRLIWLIIIYLIGGYIRLYSMPFIDSVPKSLKTTIISFLTLIFSILIIEKFDSKFAEIGITEVAYLWTPNNIVMLFLSIGLFGIFLNLKISENKIINKISSTTLGIYLLHDGVLAYWFWRDVFKNSTYQESPFLIIQILKATLIIFIVGLIIDLMRQVLEKYIVKRILDSKRFEKIIDILNNKINKVLNITPNKRKYKTE